MNNTNKINRMVTAALMAALTCVVTRFMPISIPNTNNGYIHPGDAFVLLSGIILGPLYGGLAAGIGSFLADILYSAFLYAPATLVIKALAAVVAAYSFRYIRKGSVILAGIFVGIIVTVGYYAYDSILSMTFTAAIPQIPFNLVQNVLAIVISALLFPLIKKIPQIRDMLHK